MASETDICNLALSRFADEAEVSSISPPDGSSQANHCAMFYPIARDALLEMHPWTFAKGRKSGLGELVSGLSAWEHAYAMPSNIIKPLFALPEGVVDEEDPSARLKIMVEGDTIYSHEPIGSLVVINRIIDTTRFSPLFIICLSWFLATFLVGPVTRETSGKTEAWLERKFTNHFGQATSSNANIDNNEPKHTPAWIGAR